MTRKAGESLKILAKFIVGERKRRGISQKEMATALGLTRSGYSSLETGRVEPSLAKLRQIAFHFRMDPREFMNVFCKGFGRPVTKGRPGARTDAERKRDQLHMIVEQLPDHSLSNTIDLIHLLEARDVKLLTGRK